MHKYTYISRDTSGQRFTAVAEAESRQSLLTLLKERGLTVVEVRELNPPRAAEAARPAKRFFGIALPKLGLGSADTSELAVFWRELSTMIAAGLPVVDALESIAQEVEHVKMQKVLYDVRSSMWEGFNLSQSLKRHPGCFPPMVVSLIAAAEESGSLAEVSNQLATYIENQDRLIRKVKAALTYPIFLCGFFLVVMIIATFFIIPKFRDIYSGFNAKLPWITEVVFAVNAFVLSRFPWIVASAAALLLGLILWARRPEGKEALDRISLKLPIFGKLIQRAAVAKFCRSMAILLGGGIPVNKALEMAQETSGNSVVANAIRQSREEILKGNRIAPTLKKHKIFPQMAIRLVSAGEETGSLSSLLEKIADFYESRVDAALTTINALIEPVMIVVIGGFVLIFVLSMYMPIFQLAATMKA